MFWRLGVVLAVVLGLFGCSTFQVRQDRMTGVKKIAIIGFSIEQERTNDFHLTWTSGGEGWKAQAKESKKGNVFEPGSASHVADVYRALGKSLEKEIQLAALPPESVRQNNTYSSIASQERATARWVPMNPQPMDFFSLDGVASPEKAARFSHEERLQLMQALGVDALAIAVVRIHFVRQDNLTIGKAFAMGSYTPSASTTFTLYDGKDDEPIWKDFMVPGDQLSSSVFQANGITNEELLYKKAVAASELSFHKLIERYRAELASAR